MHYDVVIIGAGMSGLAAGIRLAYFDKSVCILEKHHAWGGLNSYYKLDRREFDVGLHALTNYVPPGRRHAPLARLLRQLRLSREELALGEQHFSEVRFPGRRLRFTNDIEVLTEEIASQFPRDLDGFRRLLAERDTYDDAALATPYRSTREALSYFLRDPMLIEMLLCPAMYYGNARERDMDYAQFSIMFKSLFCEGLARPRGGVRTIIRALVRKFRGCGGNFRMNTGVETLNVDRNRVVSLTLESGETLSADVVLSCAGFHETMRLCSDDVPGTAPAKVGEVSFVEGICVLDTPPAELGHEATIIFFNDSETFVYERPREPVDLRSGVVCCPNNYAHHEDMREGVFRMTWLADYASWMTVDESTYQAAKQTYIEKALDCGERYIPGFRDRVVATDLFTPRTIQRYTGHLNGAVYGMPQKIRDGRTRLENLFICGTDQGLVGIIGAMLSGITMANLHVLSKT